MAVKLSDYILKYLSSWNSHNSMEGNNLADLTEILKQATLNDICDEYNKITVLKLWNDPLLYTFYNELIERAEGLNFTIFTSWKKNPNVYCLISFQDQSLKSGENFEAINSDELTTDVRRLIIKLILLTNEITVNLNIDEKQIKICSLESKEDKSRKVVIKNCKSNFKTDLIINYDFDVILIKSLITSLKNRIFNIFNRYTII
ncbi:MAG: hypothetical protein QW478_00575 [Candidatus Micrarchaeaceae archaeon]